MKAVVLVGGEGTRLRPLTYTTPKPILPIVEVPLLERVVTWMSAAGVDEVILSLGYRPDAFRKAFPDGTCAGVELVYAVEPEPMDTAGAIAYAASEAGIGDEVFVAANGDVLSDQDLAALIAFHQSAGAEGTILLTPVDDPSRFGVVPTNVEGRVTAFIEKPGQGEAPTNFINAGVYVLEGSILDRIPRGRRVSIEREIFPAMVAEGSLFALGSSAYWVDTGTPATYLQAQLDLLAGARPGPPAPGAVERGSGTWQLGTPGEVAGQVDGGSLIGNGASVEEGATVTGAVIGSCARVAAGAVVSGSVLLPGAWVDRDARVEGSIVGEDATVGPGAVVVNLSVVGGRAEVPAGSVLDGARLPDPSVSG